MRFKKHGMEYLCYGPDVLTEDNSEYMRGTINFYGGYWMFDSRTDVSYSARELLDIANYAGELNKLGVTP